MWYLPDKIKETKSKRKKGDWTKKCQMWAPTIADAICKSNLQLQVAKTGCDWMETTTTFPINRRLVCHLKYTKTREKREK